MGTGLEMEMDHDREDVKSEFQPSQPSVEMRAKNRRKRYLDMHPEYFSADLELAGRLALSSLFCFLNDWIVFTILVVGSDSKLMRSSSRPITIRSPYPTVPIKRRKRSRRTN